MTADRIEIAVQLLQELVQEHPSLREELRETQSQFFAGDRTAGLDEVAQALADRRHFEWFAFERPTEHEGIPAAHELFDAWMERADGETQLLCNALLHSRSGIFEIAAVERGNGLWLNDLLGQGSFPVDEPGAAAELAVGDLLAGRIFPVGESQFSLSPAVACFRNPDLREAIRRDLQTISGQRRGTLRIAQIEIERMFFGRGGGRVAPGAGAEEALELAEQLTVLLTDGGVERERAEAWVESLREAAEAAARIGEDGTGVRNQLLESLAFDTSVDLDRARELLGPAWAAFARARTPERVDQGTAVETQTGSAETGATQTPDNAPITGDGPDAVRQALDNYDRGREAGVGLEQLFNTLEQELGLDDDEEEDDATAPDFPGVVAAMVDEFLWENEQGGEALEPDQAAALKSFAQFTADVGLFESLTADHLLTFAARWSLDRGRLTNESVAIATLSALEAFARWSDSEHELELWSDFSETAETLGANLPRVVRANSTLGVGELDVGDPARLDLTEDLAEERLGVRDPNGDWYVVEAPASVLSELRVGDQIACRFEGQCALPLRCYPPEARRS